jgi:hypothetical protein
MRANRVLGLCRRLADRREARALADRLQAQFKLDAVSISAQ